MAQDLSPELKSKLIMSLGTHRRRRHLSPIETADAIDKALACGASFSTIAVLVGMDSTSTLREIHRLLKLSPKIQHCVEWGKESPSTISMSSASYVGRLGDQQEQEAAVEAIVSYQLSSKEVIQLVETRIKSGRPLLECLDVILRLRPKIERKYLFLGAVTGETLVSHLRSIGQSDRDELLRRSVNRHLGGLPGWSGKLGAEAFSLLGDASMAEVLRSLPGGFESTINGYLEAEVMSA